VAVVASLTVLLSLAEGCSSSSSALSTGCSGTATTLDITVVDDTGEPVDVCNATVTASGSGGTVTLKLVGGQSNCSYIGNVSAGGKYSLTVNAPDYPTTMSSIDVQAGCSVMTAIDVMAN
jgi:hypothetical protein